MRNSEKDPIPEVCGQDGEQTAAMSPSGYEGFIMQDEVENTQIKFEKFCRRLSWILLFLYLPVVMCGISLLVFIAGFLNGTTRFEGESLRYFLNSFELVILFGLAILGIRSIRTMRKPFTGIMSVCILIVGIVVLIYSAIMPTLFVQLHTSGYEILRAGRFCIDGFSGTVGVLIILFSRIYHYGVKLQTIEDLTV